MFRRVSAIVLKENMVLLVKMKEQDRSLPRASWVFPFLQLTDDSSPRREVNTLLNNLGVEYELSQKTFNYSPSENPKLNYVVYVAKYRDGEPEVGKMFQTYKWVPIKDITAYSTSFMDGNVAKYLNEIADRAERFE